MTKNDFLVLCSEQGIDPGIALESDLVRHALRKNTAIYAAAVINNDDPRELEKDVMRGVLSAEF